MARIQISNDPSGRIIISFPYDPFLVTKVKTIDGRRWHPVEKHWSFPNTSHPHRGGREREGVRKLESPACPVGRELFPKFSHSKTTEIYTHVSMKSLGKIMSPLDTLELAKGVMSDISCQVESFWRFCQM
jgi:hypothetical protein